MTYVFKLILIDGRTEDILCKDNIGKNIVEQLKEWKRQPFIDFLHSRLDDWDQLQYFTIFWNGFFVFGGGGEGRYFKE